MYVGAPNRLLWLKCYASEVCVKSSVMKRCQIHGGYAITKDFRWKNLGFQAFVPWRGTLLEIQGKWSFARKILK